MADMKLGPEVGMHRFQNNLRTENTANLPGRDVNNRFADQESRASNATRASQVPERYEQNGPTINVLA